MSDSKQTQTQSTTPSPASFVAEPWKKAVEEQLGRVNQMVDEAARFERQGTEQLMRAIDEVARVQKESVTYMLKLNAECRHTALEAMKQGASFVQQKVA